MNNQVRDTGNQHVADARTHNELEDAAAEMFENLRSVSRDGIGVTRPSFGPAEDAAHGILRRVAGATGLRVRIDDALNTWVDLPGSEPSLPAIVTGSHLDSVRCGGNFDGAAGVVAGLLALRELQSQPKLTRTVSLVAFRGEESAWFGTCYVGSRSMLGQLTTEMLDARSPESNQTLRDAMNGAGADLALVEQQIPLVDPRSIAQFLEVHIEQGPELIAQNAALGVVTGIRGNRRYPNVVWAGEGGHSGAVPRSLRHDAVLGVAEWIHEVELEWLRKEEGGADIVVTNGVLSTDQRQHGVTSIPALVRTSLDIRSVDELVLDRFGAWAEAKAVEIAERRGLSVSFGSVARTAPAFVSLTTVEQIEAAALCEGHVLRRMPSGAGHDAAALATAGIPVGMIFVRNDNGSHNPHEAMEVADLVAAVPILVRVMNELAQG